MYEEYRNDNIGSYSLIQRHKSTPVLPYSNTCNTLSNNDSDYIYMYSYNKLYNKTNAIVQFNNTINNKLYTIAGDFTLREDK